MVVAPHMVERRGPHGGEQGKLRTLRRALDDFTQLLAGRYGNLQLDEEGYTLEGDPLFAPARRWASATPYVVNRHRAAVTAEAALAADLEFACRDAGLPKPHVEVLETWGMPGVGLAGRAELLFKVAVSGPLLLGRLRYKGGGLFEHAEASA